MDADDLELFERSLRHTLVEHEGPQLDEALGELGWRDALEIEPQTAVGVLFELQGEQRASSSALDQVLAAAAGLESEGSACVLRASLGGCESPGRLEPERLVVRGLAGRSVLQAGEVTVLAQRSSDGCVAIQVPTSALDLREVTGIDPGLALVEVTGDVPRASLAERSVDVGWSAVAAAGQLALGHELVGASRAMLELARAHALERVQFGIPISSFQAVRHRLADALVAVESSRSLLGAAWEDATPLTASIAKAYAGRSARRVATHAQQVLAGMGFTAEHRFHGYLRRVMVLEQLFGSSSGLTRQLGAQLLADGSLPALFPL